LNYFRITNSVDIIECDQLTHVFLNLQKLGWEDSSRNIWGKIKESSTLMHVNTVIEKLVYDNVSLRLNSVDCQLIWFVAADDILFIFFCFFVNFQISYIKNKIIIRILNCCVNVYLPILKKKKTFYFSKTCITANKKRKQLLNNA